MTLDDIAVILACSKPAASMLRAGKYERDGGMLLKARYERLMQIYEQARVGSSIDGLCYECPRQDCAGCRIAELTR